MTRTETHGFACVRGRRERNLENHEVEMPREALVVAGAIAHGSRTATYLI